MSNSVWTAAGISQQNRLTALAESANETARMTRSNVALTLIVALYLALTLLSADDESLLRNAVVNLPQFETGVSLKLSYLFAPVAFLYLHLQTLFLLVVLVQKVRAFDTALGRTFGNNHTAKAECRDWLSAVSLVQGLGRTGCLAAGARILTWVGTVGIPLSLLFLIDTSFMRYQSLGYSLVHHVCFSVALTAAWIFWRYVGSGHSRLRHEQIHGLAVFLRTIKRMIAPLCTVVLVGTLWFFAWPKGYSEGQQGVATEVNLFDNLLCGASSWRGLCRTLDVSGATLAKSQSDAALADVSEKYNTSRAERYRRFHGLDLNGRALRFAEMTGVYLRAARLAKADLRGANLGLAELRYADLAGAKLNGANLTNAELRETNLFEADLNDTILAWANLINANLSMTDLSDADLRGAKLHSAILKGAKLNDATLIWTEFHGANLSGADLSNANLREATLSGANLNGADLSDVDLTKAGLVDATLTGSVLRDATLREATLFEADLTNADLSEAELGDADLSGAKMSRAKFTKARLHRADLNGAKLRMADLSDADLSDTDLSGADLSDADLSDADLSDADLSDADLRGADLRGADLRGAELDGADLRGVELGGAN